MFRRIKKIRLDRIILRALFLSSIFAIMPINAETWGEWWNKKMGETGVVKENSPTIGPGGSSEDEIGVQEDLAASQAVSQASWGICYPEMFGAYGLADSLNTSKIGSFLGYTQTNLLNNNDCFVQFDSFHDVNLWVKPYGFHSSYHTPIKKDDKKLEFSLSTVGFGAGGGYTFFEQLTVGGGAGYFYSKLDWKTPSSGDVNINGIYLGPYVNYLFPQGYVGVTLFGVANFYSGELKICKNKQFKDSSHSFDLVTRLEGGYDFVMPEEIAKDLYLQPYLRIDYLNVFESEHKDSSKISIRSRWSAYWFSLLALRASKTILYTKSEAFIPSISVGWVKRAPLSSKNLEVKQLQDFSIVNVKGEGKDQLQLGCDLMCLRSQGFLVGVNYEAFIGNKAPMHSGKLIVEWSW